MSDRSRLDEPLATRTEAGEETVDLPAGLDFFTAGQVLGDRYEILEMLGRGGMGEVWRAFDLKLRVEVGLKALREDLFQNERRLELLRQEVRAAREVVSPNVCRIFDLIEIDGRELVSMEYVDGATLLGVLQERGPLELKEAQDIASQFLAGLEAIHKAGLVHRDVKPENIMLTRAGRVVVMDFGLARGPESGAGSVSGTPAYMAPEHAAGSEVDARADVYSAGVVLAEMVSPDGIKSYESRQSVWEGVRSEPAQVPESPWAPVIQRAVARDRERRQNSAHTLIRELEDVTLRVEGAEDLHPYPGLASFSEADAEYFFGREAEIERLWRKLDGPSRLLALVGPSGAGKTSFLQAGLISHAGPGWRCVISKPGTNPVLSLSRALAPEMAGDVEAMDLLLRFDDPDVAIDVVSRWRRTSDRALLIVDQFEELFTQNSAEEQRRFAGLLARLVLEADVFVILSMRDDFMMRCRDFDALEPIFSEMTALPALAGGSLRRALVRPATKCGYRFEDDELVEEILSEVEGERGALPMLAFAASRLWEKRGRDSGLLTRQAYHHIGGVGGALARHAEATVDRIGVERIPIVRELFRNLVTAEGTRAVREWDELLSIFSDSSDESPEEVLRALIDDRLLTSYETREDENEPTRQVEIIHESLLANWPRLVRWQTQDADAVQVREHLRQAARTWDEHDRTDDMLWTGSAYRQFSVWRESYPGGLTEIEEAFAAAMTSFATRRRRRRRIAATAAVVVFAVVAIIFAGLWRRSVQETRRAEAQKLLALGQIEIEEDPTAALAYARASIEVSDTYEGRLLALKALSTGSVHRVLPRFDGSEIIAGMVYSPDGERAAIVGYDQLRVVHHSGGQSVLVDEIPPHGQGHFTPFFDHSTGHLGVYKAGEIRVYEVPGFTEIAHQQVDPAPRWVFGREGGVFLHTHRGDSCRFERWRFNSPTEVVAKLPSHSSFLIDSTGRWVAYVPVDEGSVVYLKSLVDPTIPVRRLHSHNEPISSFFFHPEFEWIAVVGDEPSNTITLWELDGGTDGPIKTLDNPGLYGFSTDHHGNRIIEENQVDGRPKVSVWDLGLPDGAAPLVLKSRVMGKLGSANIGPNDRWIVDVNLARAAFWPLPEDPVIVIPNEGLAGGAVYQIAFAPDGKTVAIPNYWGLYLQPIHAGDDVQHIVENRTTLGVEFDPDGRFIFGASKDPSAIMVFPTNGSAPISLEGFTDAVTPGPIAFDPERELVAAGASRGPAEEKTILVWNLADGSRQTLGPVDNPGEGLDGAFSGLEFLADGSLLSTSRDRGIRRWRLDDGSSEEVLAGNCAGLVASSARDLAVALCGELGGALHGLSPMVIDVATNQVRTLDHFHGEHIGVALSPDGILIATGTHTGEIMIGRVSGGDPHILYGHETTIYGMAFSPEGRLIAAADGGGNLRVWPVPDMTKPPLQALPLAEVMAKLDSFTNLRVVRDETSPIGWKTEIGRFQGWETVPEW